MQQFCPYGSVRGASGQLASLPRQKGSGPLKTGLRRTKNQQLAEVSTCQKRVFPQTARTQTVGSLGLKPLVGALF
jgi:hypothetical protein